MAAAVESVQGLKQVDVWVMGQNTDYTPHFLTETTQMSVVSALQASGINAVAVHPAARGSATPIPQILKSAYLITKWVSALVAKRNNSLLRAELPHFIVVISTGSTVCSGGNILRTIMATLPFLQKHLITVVPCATFSFNVTGILPDGRDFSFSMDDQVLISDRNALQSIKRVRKSKEEERVWLRLEKRIWGMTSCVFETKLSRTKQNPNFLELMGF